MRRDATTDGLLWRENHLMLCVCVYVQTKEERREKILL